jgi:hypothetical protein
MKPEEKAIVTGITKEMERKDVPAYNGRLKNMAGRWLEEIPDAEITRLGKAKLITDMFGVFPYAPQADDTLKKYLNLLHPEGSIFIYFPTGSMQKSTVAAEGKKIGLQDWVKNLESSGLSVTIHNAKESRSTVEIRFKSGETAESVAPRIPKLKLLQADGDQPPLRHYEQIK